MKIQTTLALALITFCIDQTALAEEGASMPFAEFGTWSSPCDAWGVAATCTSTWRGGLSADHVVQDYEIVRAADQSPIFTGRGLYRLVDGTVDGVWEDSRGVIQDLSGSYRGDVLRVIWGDAQTEIGRSIYTWEAGALSVQDSVLTDDGWRDFMTIDYSAP